jgi:hypothetical protein
MAEPRVSSDWVELKLRQMDEDLWQKLFMLESTELWKGAFKDLLDARRRIAELEKYAERYRAIRAGKWAIRQGQPIVQIDRGNYAYPLGTGGDLDSAVDTAIAAQRQKEGE